MNLKVLTIVFVSLLLVGCTGKSTPPEPEIQTVYKTKKVYVSTGCKVPDIDCSFKGEGFEPTKKLLDCLILHKRTLEALDSNTTKK